MAVKTNLNAADIKKGMQLIGDRMPKSLFNNSKEIHKLASNNSTNKKVFSKMSTSGDKAGLFSKNYSNNLKKTVDESLKEKRKLVKGLDSHMPDSPHNLEKQFEKRVVDAKDKIKSLPSVLREKESLRGAEFIENHAEDFENFAMGKALKMHGKDASKDIDSFINEDMVDMFVKDRQTKQAGFNIGTSIQEFYGVPLMDAYNAYGKDNLTQGNNHMKIAAGRVGATVGGLYAGHKVKKSYEESRGNRHYGY